MARKKPVIRHGDFVRDLGRGHVGEDIVEAFFEKEFGIDLENKSARNPDWDLKVAGLVTTGNEAKMTKKKKDSRARLLRKFKKTFGETIEVKFDEAAARYKNFFIEIMFNMDAGQAGAATKCKSDLVVWVVPAKRRKFNIYIFKRAEFLSWLLIYTINSSKSIKLKTPGISPMARGIAVPIEDAAAGFACLGKYEYKL